MLATVEIRGEKELQRILRVLPQKVSRNLQLKALREGSKPLIKAAKNNAPSRTGTLIKSIGTTLDRKTKGASIYVGVRSGKRQRYDGWYGWFVERGTKGFGKRKKVSGDVANRHSTPSVIYSKGGSGLKANPFFERAWDDTQTTVYEKIKVTIQEVVVKFLKQNAPKYY